MRRSLGDHVSRRPSLEDKRVAAFRDSTLRNIFYILRQRMNEPGMEFYSQGATV